MKKSVKIPALVTIFLFFLYGANAQLKLPVASALSGDIKKIIEDYPNHFTNLKGELLTENIQSAEYSCVCKVSGAEETTITGYSSKENNVYSWQAIMLTTDEFEKARKQFRSLYNQLNNLAVKPFGERTFYLKGSYDSPEEEKKFSSVLFSFSPNERSVKKLKVELTMQYYEPMEWKVKILIYDREREDNERGKLTED